MKRNRPDYIDYAVQTFECGPDHFLTGRGDGGFRIYERAVERFNRLRFNGERVRIVRCVNGVPRETVKE